MVKTKKNIPVFDKILDFGIRGSAFLIFLSWFVVCLEIGSRKFLNHPLVWTVEAAEFMILYALFLGAAWVLREEEHITIDILFSFFDTKNRILLLIINSFLGAIVCIVLVYFGTFVTVSHYQEDIRTFTAMQLPKWPFLLIVPIGSLFLLLQFFRRAFNNIQKIKIMKKAD